MIIYNDNHWGSPIGIDETIKQVSDDAHNMHYNKGPKVYGLGDNFDLANCAMKDVEKFRNLRIQVMSWFPEGAWIDGNHSRTSYLNDRIILTNSKGRRVVMVHGDWESWPEGKALAYRMKPHGASEFKRMFTKTWNDFYDKFFNSKIKKDFLMRAAALAKATACQVYICAHKHPKTLIETEYDGIKIIVLPRGRNLLDLENL